MALHRIVRREPLVAPALVGALEGWVDAGGCGVIAAGHIARDGEVVATFDLDALLDYRARRPLLDIEQGRLTQLLWPELVVRRVRLESRDLLVLTGPEPDYRWREFQESLVELALELGVVESVSLGSIGAMVPHTRPTPVLTTGAARKPTDTDPPLPAEHLRVPAAAINLLEVTLAERGIPSVGFWAQVPHYIAGSYTAGALALVQRVAAHLGVTLPTEELAEEATRERARFDEVVQARPEAQAYLRQLEEAATTGAREPEGDIAGEVERFLREITGENRNPSEGP